MTRSVSASHHPGDDSVFDPALLVKQGERRSGFLIGPAGDIALADLQSIAENRRALLQLRPGCSFATPNGTLNYRDGPVWSCCGRSTELRGHGASCNGDGLEVPVRSYLFQDPDTGDAFGEAELIRYALWS
jgi:hypothetical protein